MIIREATDDDWDEIWPFFQAICRAGETYTYSLDTTYEEGRELWMERPPSHTVVAVDGAGRVVGSAKMGPNRPGNGSHIGTASFMVDPAASGQGIGRALGEEMVRWHRERGFRGVQFNAVVEANRAAIRLWQRLGFRIVGTVPGAFRHPTEGYVGLHVMFLELDHSGSP